jgi:hypothetical protein
MAQVIQRRGEGGRNVGEKAGYAAISLILPAL